MMCKRFIILVVLFAGCLFALAQYPDFHDEEDSTFIINEERPSDTASFAAEVTGDTSVVFRDYKINADTVLAWKNSSQYSWIKNIDSLLAHSGRIIKTPAGGGKFEKVKPEKSESQDAAPPPDSPPTPGYLKVILWVAAGALVLFIIFQLFLGNGFFKTGGRRSKVTAVSEEETEEHISDKDFEALMRRASAACNFRLAARYLFLLTLQKLEEKELIRFAPDKTNSAYLFELPQNRRNSFAQLSLYYEYIWYGHATVSPENFAAIETKFRDFLSRI